VSFKLGVLPWLPVGQVEAPVHPGKGMARGIPSIHSGAACVLPFHSDRWTCYSHDAFTVAGPMTGTCFAMIFMI